MGRRAAPWVDQSTADATKPRWSKPPRAEPQVYDATMGGVPGAAMARSVQGSPSAREWRGIFLFEPEHQTSIARLADVPRSTVFEGVIDGRVRKLDVALTGCALDAGLAFFEAEGEPY